MAMCSSWAAICDTRGHPFGDTRDYLPQNCASARIVVGLDVMTHAWCFGQRTNKMGNCHETGSGGTWTPRLTWMGGPQTSIRAKVWERLGWLCSRERNWYRYVYALRIAYADAIMDAIIEPSLQEPSSIIIKPNRALLSIHVFAVMSIYIWLLRCLVVYFQKKQPNAFLPK